MISWENLWAHQKSVWHGRRVHCRSKYTQLHTHQLPLSSRCIWRLIKITIPAQSIYWVIIWNYLSEYKQVCCKQRKQSKVILCGISLLFPHLHSKHSLPIYMHIVQKYHTQCTQTFHTLGDTLSYYLCREGTPHSYGEIPLSNAWYAKPCPCGQWLQVHVN